MIEDCTGVVLAGGTSRRMGRDKAAIRVGSETLLERVRGVLRRVFAEVICVGRFGGDGCLADERPGCGPLGGIETALKTVRAGWVFVVACDMPLLSADAIAELWERGGRGSGGLIVATTGGRLHPLAAFYPASLRPRVTEALDAGAISVTAFVRGLGVRPVEADEGGDLARALTNVNDPGELKRALAALGVEGSDA
jgi:molybdopterin-guanine dinucleotide biosynthesis protein A